MYPTNKRLLSASLFTKFVVIGTMKEDSAYALAI
jgi:hypothetical protein